MTRQSPIYPHSQVIVRDARAPVGPVPHSERPLDLFFRRLDFFTQVRYPDGSHTSMTHDQFDSFRAEQEFEGVRFFPFDPTRPDGQDRR